MSGWESDRVTAADGTEVPVRATARRPAWSALPAEVRAFVEDRVGAPVRSAWSAGTGFTPGFASRLDLADGRRAFVKAASSADDRLHGWPLSDAYREEARKLALLPDGVGAPTLSTVDDVSLAGEQLVMLVFEHIEGRPPRRPWRPEELEQVVGAVADLSARLTPAPAGVEWVTVGQELLGGVDARMASIREQMPADPFVDVVEELCARAVDAIAGDTLVHLDLRDDNVLLGDDGSVWFVDWNWPVVGAPWIDLVCLLLSARGDGLDADALLAAHPLSREADPGAVDALLAVLWSFWAVAVTQPVPDASPHLRDHQRWYLAASRDWLDARLASR